MVYPWKVFSTWAPFQIDALGLVTLLGADEVNLSVGRLAPSQWLEFMPLLAGFVFAGDRFRAKQPIFTLYNISSGIVTGNLAAWFTRWMSAQDFQLSRSLVYWEIEDVSNSNSTVQLRKFVVAGVISFVFTGFLLAMTVLSADWYGLANTIAIIILIAVRSYMLQASRNAINRAVAVARPLPTTFRGALLQWENNKRKNGISEAVEEASRPRENSREWRPEVAKVLVIMPDSRAVTMFIPEHLLRPIFVTDVYPLSPWIYRIAQWIGWVSFVVHVVTLGMANLATQLYVIAIMIIPTILISYGFGCDDSRIFKGWRKFHNNDDSPPYIYWAGKRLKATVMEWPQEVEFAKNSEGTINRRDPLVQVSRTQRSTARQDLYAWLNLSAEEQKSLSDWHLLPHTRGKDDPWWRDFEAKQALIRNDPPDLHAFKVGVQQELGRMKVGETVVRGGIVGTVDIEKGEKNPVK
ncbi:hypothetical protein N7447_009332 [Penicillium robsamsonii]|uniref:uncharacterized protein n=1 Tax=Penicillium robsamsonii TaxID=1792511 RepID=UPI002547202D|nr:uncharacterized protein N7447_009332 [Penicillium robsamsonii]KAJ5817099.1 hypothetical protein N7447_009332 [Penicillium robsamsonii]